MRTNTYLFIFRGSDSESKEDGKDRYRVILFLLMKGGNTMMVSLGLGLGEIDGLIKHISGFGRGIGKRESFRG